MIISWFVQQSSGDTEEDKKFDKHIFDTCSGDLPRTGDVLYLNDYSARPFKNSVKYRVVDAYHKIDLTEIDVSVLELEKPEGNERWVEMEKKLEERGEHFAGLRQGFIKTSRHSGQVILVKA